MELLSYTLNSLLFGIIIGLIVIIGVIVVEKVYYDKHNNIASKVVLNNVVIKSKIDNNYGDININNNILEKTNSINDLSNDPIKDPPNNIIDCYFNKIIEEEKLIESYYNNDSVNEVDNNLEQISLLDDNGIYNNDFSDYIKIKRR